MNRILAIAFASLIAISCRRGPSVAEDHPTPPDPTPIAEPGLPHAFRVSDRIYSGGSPEGDAGFADLERLGVKTIISVDGALPEVETAKRHGIRYIHLPVGYDRISRERVLELTKAAESCDGPIYVHCHHGTHRGPTAVAAIQMSLDPNWDAERAEAWLKLVGTDRKYVELWSLPRTLIRPTAAEVERVPVNFSSAAPVGDITRLMVDVDATFDHLKLAKAAGWTTPKGHPDIDPPHEALLLVEHFRETARLESAQKRGTEFIGLLKQAEATAGELESTLRDRNSESAAKTFDRLAATCGSCHQRFRDRPVSR
jgi:protein tyrosine phosphatase (PTP) superfamily phosphohydrolase (DUF442 family)